MSGKFMKIKKIVIPMMTFIILTSQLCGCAMFKPSEMVEAINQGESITIEVAEPSYKIEVQGEQVQEVTWIQLDRLKTFNDGFRQSFDKAFNITVVNENNTDGKSGCLYVNQQGERDGNTTLQDAFRNKTFVKKYWSNADVRNSLIKSASTAYVDISSDNDALIASFNAYYNLLNDAKNPDSFNATQSLTREQFYTLVFKATTPVQNIEVSGELDNNTEYTKYASQVMDNGFLQTSNKSLDSASMSGSITRAEAIYMIVNSMFPDELAKVTDKDKAFNDTKNAGDLALSVGFKEKVKVEGQKEKQLVEKERWQAYVLAYSLQNPDKGLQEELYKPMVVAKNLALIDGSESRWDESISKAESIQLLQKAFLAQNELYGYLSEVEYGTINPNNFTAASDEEIDLNDIKIPVDNPVYLVDSETGDMITAPGNGEPSMSIDEIQEPIVPPETSLTEEEKDSLQAIIDEYKGNNPQTESTPTPSKETSSSSTPSKPSTPNTSGIPDDIVIPDGADTELNESNTGKGGTTTGNDYGNVLDR